MGVELERIWKMSVAATTGDRVQMLLRKMEQLNKISKIK
jgi:hypothetical protein